MDGVVLSPGPGRPEEAKDIGCCRQLIRYAIEREIPLWGICLGHQALAHELGGRIGHYAPAVRHGQVDEISVYHGNNDGRSPPLFTDIPEMFSVVRYHSLVVIQVPESLRVTAYRYEEDTNGGDHGGGAQVVMAVQHETLPLYGGMSMRLCFSVYAFVPPLPLLALLVSLLQLLQLLPILVQFHPESICTEFGTRLMRNFYRVVSQYAKSSVVERLDWRGYNLLPSFVDQVPDRRTTPLQSLVFRSSPVAMSMDGTCKTNHRLLFHLYERYVGIATDGIWLHSARVGVDSRFSVMGRASSGRESMGIGKKIQYDVASRQLSEHFLHGIRKQKVPTTISFFEWLKQRMTPLESNEQLQLDPNGRLVPLDQALPFNVSCGYFGYLGYEILSETELFRPVHGAWDSVEGQGDGDPSRRHTDACLLWLDRCVVVDHLEGTVYFLALISSDAGVVDDILQEWSRIQSILQEEPATFTLPSAFTWPKKHPSATHERDYLQAIEASLDFIHEGETYEVCLTTDWNFYVPKSSLSSSFSFSNRPWQMYRTLCERNPAPYAAYMRCTLEHEYDNDSDHPTIRHILSSSPERFLKISRDGVVSMKPIKGTAPRGFDPEQQHPSCMVIDPVRDLQLARSLQLSVKERAENLMIVDLIRNDLNWTCDRVSVPKLMVVESYETVHQLVTEVQGSVRHWHGRQASSETQQASVIIRHDPRSSALDVLRYSFPPGSMTGAPKKRTVERLQDLERPLWTGSCSYQHPRHQQQPLEASRRRGVYSGILGFLGVQRACEFSVIIRTAVVDETVDELDVHIGAGGAITALSDPCQEYQEMVEKVSAVLPCLAIHPTSQT